MSDTPGIRDPMLGDEGGLSVLLKTIGRPCWGQLGKFLQQSGSHVLPSLELSLGQKLWVPYLIWAYFSPVFSRNHKIDKEGFFTTYLQTSYVLTSRYKYMTSLRRDADPCKCYIRDGNNLLGFLQERKIIPRRGEEVLGPVGRKFMRVSHK